MKSLGLFLIALIIFLGIGITPRQGNATPLPVDMHTCLPDDDQPAPLTPCPKPPRR